VASSASESVGEADRAQARDISTFVQQPLAPAMGLKNSYSASLRRGGADSERHI